MKKMVGACLSLLIALSCMTALAQAPSSIAIMLDGNPSTGFEWTCSVADDAVVCLCSDDYEASSDAAGSGGLYTFVFEAVAPGETSVTFRYARPFEASQEDQALTYVATVDESGNLSFKIAEDAY
ncbi:MAG: protease inhibitor I42 family protein [Clostridia bacterium]